MRAMLLAAGLGARLRPLTDRLPKPAVPLMNRPLATFAIEHLLRAGVDRLAVNAHHLASEVETLVANALPTHVNRAVSIETELLGTGGGIARALAALEAASAPMRDDEAVFVMNADVLFAPELDRALALHRASDAFATMVVRRDPRAQSLGPVDIDAGSRVRRLLGAPVLEDTALDTMMFTGVHVLSARAVRDLPERGCVIRQGYRRWIDRGETVMGFVEGSPFRDLGSPREYLAAHLDLLRGVVRWPGIVPGASLVHPSARVDGAILDECVIGPGAYVARGVRLARAVVWPSAVVREPGADVILFDDQRLSAS
jgi:mannose-1-phosphate guanylyltransferase